MQKELDRMPEFDISIPNRNENKIQVVKNIIILSDDSGDDGSCLGSLEDLIGDIELDLEPIDRGPEVSCTPPKENI